MNRFARVVLVCSVFALALGPSSADAQKKGRGKKAQAKALFQQGQKQHTLGDFAAALESFTKAYEKMALPAFLFNIAQCHKEMKNYERAVFFFEGYIRDDARAPADMVNSLIAESNEALAKEKELARKEKEADEARARADAERKAAAEARAARDTAGAKEIAEMRRIAKEMRDAQRNAAFQPPGAEPAPSGPAVYETWWFWTIVGGVALAAGGTAAGVALRPTQLPSGSLGTFDHRP